MAVKLMKPYRQVKIRTHLAYRREPVKLQNMHVVKFGETDHVLKLVMHVVKFGETDHVLKLVKKNDYI
jgi:hypothetical protein